MKRHASPAAASHNTPAGLLVTGNATRAVVAAMSVSAAILLALPITAYAEAPGAADYLSMYETATGNAAYAPIHTMADAVYSQSSLQDVVGGTGSADEGQTEIQIESYNSTQNARVNELKQEFKNDVRNLLEYAGTEEYGERSGEILEEYDGFFRVVIEHARTSTDTREFSEQEVLAAIDYIFYETIKDERIKAVQEASTEQIRGVEFLEWFGIPTADAACPPTTKPIFKQLQIDINGGFYGIYSFNGQNKLLTTDPYTKPNCVTEFVLTFADEDHPYLDMAYDHIRNLMYARTTDIESFTIENNRVIVFDNTWSSNGKFDCLIVAVGCHHTTAKAYVPGQTVYVSNTWNHMMDTSDTNGSSSKRIVS